MAVLAFAVSAAPQTVIQAEAASVKSEAYARRTLQKKLRSYKGKRNRYIRVVGNKKPKKSGRYVYYYPQVRYGKGYSYIGTCRVDLKAGTARFTKISSTNKRTIRKAKIVVPGKTFRLWTVKKTSPSSIRLNGVSMDSLKPVYAKAKAIGKGKTAIEFPSNSGTRYSFIVFTAPASGTYKINFSNVKVLSASNQIANGFIGFWGVDGYGYFVRKDAATKGGKSSSMYVCTNYSYSLGGHPTIETYTNLPSRTATIRLKKGERLYMNFYLASASGNRATIDVTIR